VVHTHRVTAADNIVDVIDQYTKPLRRPGDWLTISEKVVAVTQGRAIPESRIKIGLLARLLWRHVRQVPYGIGLRSPSSMQCAINECGRLRILAASIVGLLGKLVGRRGDFYRIAGMQAATIDAAHTSPLQPDCVILGPKDPEKVVAAIRERTGCEAAVMDINDIGGSWVLAATGGIDRRLLENIMRDNPCGQKDEQTPIAIVRPAADTEGQAHA
jgi:F420-0:gamma-glutamyl ligase